MVQLAHGHYTVDIIIAYFITTRLFWLYHTLANNANLKVSCFPMLADVCNRSSRLSPATFAEQSAGTRVVVLSVPLFRG